MDSIRVIGAYEGNLKNITVSIPRSSLTALTGVSGSGKSTLAMDVLFQECQRQYLEAMGMQGIRKPGVQAVRGASPAVCIKPGVHSRNPRSTVASMTGIGATLRAVYEKLCVSACPVCGQPVAAAYCREQVEKHGEDYQVFLFCSHCGTKIEKLTLSHFSPNTRQGACPTCQGLGCVTTVNRATVLDESKPSGAGGVLFWTGKYGQYQANSFARALEHYGVPAGADLPVGRLDEVQRAILLYGVESERVRELFPHVQPPKTVEGGRFEGIETILLRRLEEKGGATPRTQDWYTSAPCPNCGGEKLNPRSRAAQIDGMRLPQLLDMPLSGLLMWLDRLSIRLDERGKDLAGDYIRSLQTQIRRIGAVGLGYLSAGRQSMTLSGGEDQRIRLAAALDSELTGVLYIMDEPTLGLHPCDVQGVIDVLYRLRDLGNTVLVVEHDADVVRAADWVVDLGPCGGKGGGEVIVQGAPRDVTQNKCSVTGQWLRCAPAMPVQPRKARAWVRIRGASQNNLRQLDADFPVGCLTAVTGVSGSGKTTLVFEVLAKGSNCVQGLEQFERVVAVDQTPPVRMSRSNVATFSGLYDSVRRLFASQSAAKEHGLTVRHFSFNSPGGRCENCGGLGTVESHLLFFEDVQIPCPVCHGQRFEPEVLSVLFAGSSISDVLSMTASEAAQIFAGQPDIMRVLGLLGEVGLGYLQLGQSLTTLSCGEAQRLRLARELLGGSSKNTLYLLDEPTAGLHPQDVEQFAALLERMLESGATVVMAEHDRQLIRRADWVIDLGPGGGENGGRVVAMGPVAAVMACADSVTGRFLQTQSQ